MLSLGDGGLKVTQAQRTAASLQMGLAGLWDHSQNHSAGHVVSFPVEVTRCPLFQLMLVCGLLRFFLSLWQIHSETES